MTSATSVAELQTERLFLRAWREEDLEAFADPNADPEVMRKFSGPLARAESGRFARRSQERFWGDGFGLCAVELRSEGSFIGFIGAPSRRPVVDARLV